MTTNKNTNSVPESVSYDNLIDEVAEYEQGFQPKRPEKTPDFPFELKMHVWRAREAQRLARTLQKR